MKQIGIIGIFGPLVIFGVLAIEHLNDGCIGAVVSAFIWGGLAGSSFGEWLTNYRRDNKEKETE